MNVTSSKGKVLILLPAVLLVFILLIVISSNWDSNQEINTININGAIIVPESDIRDTIFKIVGNNKKNDVKLDVLENKITKNDYIKNVNISFAVSGDLNIDVFERTPVSLIATDDGSISCFDEEGMMLPYIDKFSSVDFLLIKDVRLDKSLQMVLSTVAKYISMLTKAEYTLIKAGVSDITYDYILNSIIIRTADKRQFIMGNADNIDYKLNSLLSVLINGNNINLNYKSLDCRWNGMVVMKN